MLIPILDGLVRGVLRSVGLHREPPARPRPARPVPVAAAPEVRAPSPAPAVPASPPRPRSSEHFRASIGGFDRSRLRSIERPPERGEAIELWYVRKNWEEMNPEVKGRFLSLPTYELNKQLRLIRDTYPEQQLTNPWTPYTRDAVRSKFRTVLQVHDLASMLAWMVQWERYFDHLTKAFKATSQRVEETIEAYNKRKREERERNIKIATSVFSLALNAFGAAPLTNIINANINKYFDVMGPSAFGEVPSWSLGADGSVGVSREVSYGTTGRSGDAIMGGSGVLGAIGDVVGGTVNVVENWGREGVAGMATGGVSLLSEWGVGRVTDSIKEKFSLRSVPPHDFAAMMDTLNEGFRSLQENAFSRFREINEYLYREEVCLPIARGVAYLHALQGERLYGGPLSSRLETALDAMNSHMFEDLTRVFQCPVADPHTHHFEADAIEKLLWAGWFRTNREALRRNHGIAREIAQRLVDVGIATRRTGRLMFGRWSRGYTRTHAAEAVAAEDGSVIIGAKQAGRESLEHVLTWAAAYPMGAECRRLMGIQADMLAEVETVVRSVSNYRQMVNPDYVTSVDERRGLILRHTA